MIYSFKAYLSETISLKTRSAMDNIEMTYAKEVGFYAFYFFYFNFTIPNNPYLIIYFSFNVTEWYLFILIKSCLVR